MKKIRECVNFFLYDNTGGEYLNLSQQNYLQVFKFDSFYLLFRVGSKRILTILRKGCLKVFLEGGLMGKVGIGWMEGWKGDWMGVRRVA